MEPFKFPVNDGSPWLDYQELTKSAYTCIFVFPIENFLSFILREICITYPCAVNGRSQLPLKVTAELSSTTNQCTPIEIPENLFSSPSQNFRQGTLDEDAQGQRLQPVIFNYPCEYGDTVKVTVSGVPTGLLIGCLLTGRKRGGK
jgi:hypothetical protein